MTEAVRSTIPSLMKRTQDEHEDVRLRAVDVIGELANHGERSLKNHCGTADPDHEAEFREDIARMRA
jgi:HEAT repeat protein